MPSCSVAWGGLGSAVKPGTRSRCVDHETAIFRTAPAQASLYHLLSEMEHESPAAAYILVVQGFCVRILVQHHLRAYALSPVAFLRYAEQNRYALLPSKVAMWISGSGDLKVYFSFQQDQICS
jgi:hypothetical protein